MIFETERLLVRKLTSKDIDEFYKLESNPKVLQYATGDVKTISECEEELKNLILKYDAPNNNFWIYAVETKQEKLFVGSLAIITDENNCEIGYRFIEEYWGNGFATESFEGLIHYCKSIKLPKLTGYVVDENIASAKILERFNFKPVHKFVSEDIGLPETKYELEL